MSVDNPYYFYNDKSPRTPDSTTSSRGFSIFKRRNSKGSSPKVAIPPKTRSITSASLSADASILGISPRASVGSMGSYSGAACMQAFELQNNFNSIYRRSGAGDMCRERLGSYNESCTYNTENDEVFIQSPVKSHHTLPGGHTTTKNGVRRHSVGHLINRQRCPSFTDEVPNVMAPKPPVMSQHSKYRANNRRRSDNCSDNSNMDDILLITAKHSERAILWANFLKNRFDKITKQRGRKPFNFLHIKIDDGPFSNEIAQKCHNTALQIVILCPALLAISHSFLMAQLKPILNIEKVLGILLDVKEETVLDMHKGALPSFRKWRRCSVRDNDQSLIGNILGIATDILGRALCQRPPCQEMTASNLKNFNSSEGFTVIPRKVKIGQNKIVALLNDPLDKDDVVKISIEKSGEFIEVQQIKQRNPYTVQFCIPESCMEISTMIDIHIVKNDVNIGSRPVKCESRARELEQLLRTQDSPIEFMCQSLGIGSTDRDALDLHLLQCFQKNMPPNFDLLSGPFEKQHHFLSMKDTSPEEYPSLLHFAAKWGFERLCMQLMECPGGDAACEIRNCMGKTPFELADVAGFHKLANSIKSFAQIHEFTTMYHYFKGISDNPATTKVVIEAKPSKSPSSSSMMIAKSPEDLRNFCKQTSLENNEQVTGEYMEMSSGSEQESTTTTMAVTNLNYISVESEANNLQSSDDLCKSFKQVKVIEGEAVTSNELKITEPPYYQSENNNKYADKFSQECSNLLESCSSDYSVPPSNIPVPAPAPAEDDGNYVYQPSNRPVEFPHAPNYMNGHVHFSRMSSETNLEQKKKSTLSLCKNGTLKRAGSDASSMKANADDELAEIMYDFKNNVLTIREVEQLVEKWKNRNDVKQSFKEKQDQIEKLREEYDRLQDHMKEKLKRDTPFDRIKKLFSRGKSTERKPLQSEEDPNETMSSMTSYQSSSHHRPMSTLSLHSVSSSSSSSGRLSTGSACSGASLGDSGTHSDHEDRRNNSFGICRLGSPGSLMDNYMVPPAPRPVFTPGSTPTGEEKDRPMFPRIQTPTSPNAPSPSSEHYMMFPSNVPVYAATSAEHISPTVSNGYLNTIVEAKETDHQRPTVQPIKVQNFNGIERNSNIIYGKLKKTPPKDLCSSFKWKAQLPAGQTQKEATIVAATGEEYQNVEATSAESSHNYINI